MHFDGSVLGGRRGDEPVFERIQITTLLNGMNSSVATISNVFETNLVGIEIAVKPRRRARVIHRNNGGQERGETSKEARC